MGLKEDEMKNSDETNSNEVQVYFHGSFGFRTIDGYLEAYIPDINAHVNLIGTWAGLHAMKRGFEYRLEGIAKAKQPPPRPKLNESLNVVFEHLSQPVSGGFFCKIVVPWPEQKIQSLCPEPVDKATLFSRITSGAGGKIPKPSKLSHIQLCRFRTDGKPRFVGRKIATSGKAMAAVAKPEFVEDEEGCRIYHLFCEPPHVFPTEADRGRVVESAAKMADEHGMGGHGLGALVGLEAIRQYAPFTQHEHIALQQVLRMFPELQDVEVSVPDAVVASDSPPSQAPENGIRPKDLRSLYHMYPHFEGGLPACNPGGADGGS
jgi:hypothetical protein